MPLGLTYSATCQIYWVIWDFTRSLPRLRYHVSAKKNGITKNLEREMQFDLRNIQIHISNYNNLWLNFLKH